MASSTSELKPDENSVWKLINNNMSCPVMSTAVRLANEMIFSNEHSNNIIYLNYNVENSQVDLMEFTQHIVKLANDPTPMPNIDREGFLKECFKKDFVFIHPELVKYCRSMTEKTPGFHLVVFFLAITLLHQTSHWAFKNQRDEIKNLSPLDEKFEFELNNGILRLQEFKGEPRLSLILEDKGGEDVVIDSPQFRNFFLNRNKQRQQQSPIATSQSNEQTYPNSEARIRPKTLNLMVEFKSLSEVEIIIKNELNEDVVIPSDFSSSYFVIKLSNALTDEPVHKRRSCKKNIYVRIGVPLSTLRPNQTLKYSTDCKALILPYFKIVNDGEYEIQMRLKIGSSPAFPHPQVISSNWISEVLHLRAEQFKVAGVEEENINENESPITLGTVPSPNTFVYRFNKQL